MYQFYIALQAWLQYLTSFWWVRGLGMIAAFWILMQLLSNTWAGGYLFDRKFAWISSMIAAIVVFVVFVLPWVTWQLLLGIVGTAVLVGLAVFMKNKWH